ncbi:MAG TPA: HlyD family efflux transporter periplasmic adaptor subunit, partial [Allocoleopsis sp.]
VTRDYQGQLQTSQAQVAEAEAGLHLAQEEYNRYADLAGTGAISDLQVSEKEQALKVSEARLEQARANLNPSTGTIAAAQERIAQEQAKGEATLASINRERESLIQHQIQVQNQISRSQAELQQVEINLTKSVIRASVDGIILNLNLRNQGQVVRAGEAIAQIAPANIPYIVIASVTAQDIANVKVGQAVQLRVSAYPYPDYGTLKGKVVAIAPDATTPQNNGNAAQSTSAAGKAAFFSVTIQPEKPYLVKADRNYPIRSGMEARADIISKEETVLTFVLRKARLLTDL